MIALKKSNSKNLLDNYVYPEKQNKLSCRTCRHLGPMGGFLDLQEGIHYSVWLVTINNRITWIFWDVCSISQLPLQKIISLMKKALLHVKFQEKKRDLTKEYKLMGCKMEP